MHPPELRGAIRPHRVGHGLTCAEQQSFGRCDGCVRQVSQLASVNDPDGISTRCALQALDNLVHLMPSVWKLLLVNQREDLMVPSPSSRRPWSLYRTQAYIPDRLGRVLNGHADARRVEG